MCGLFGYSLKPDADVNELSHNALQELGILCNLHRGKDAWGWAASYKEEITIDKSDLTSKVWFFKEPGPGDEGVNRPGTLPKNTPTNILMHTRAATIGSPDDNSNNHPVTIGNIWVTHNGGISNHEGLKNQLKDLGPFPEVDSSVIPALIAQSIKDPGVMVENDWTVLIEWFKKTTGGIAFAGLWEDYPEYVLLGRWAGSPLYIGINQYGVFWASEGQTLLTIEKNMEDMKFDVIRGSDPNNLFLLKEGELVEAIHVIPKVLETNGHWGRKITKNRVSRTGHIIGNNEFFQNAAHWSERVASQPSSIVMEEKDGKKRLVPNRQDYEVYTPTEFDETAVGALKSVIGDAHYVLVPKVTYIQNRVGFEDTVRVHYNFVTAVTELLFSGTGVFRDSTVYNVNNFVEYGSRWKLIEEEKKGEKKDSEIKEFVVGKDLPEFLQKYGIRYSPTVAETTRLHTQKPVNQPVLLGPLGVATKRGYSIHEGTKAHAFIEFFSDDQVGPVHLLAQDAGRKCKEHNKKLRYHESLGEVLECNETLSAVIRGVKLTVSLLGPEESSHYLFIDLIEEVESPANENVACDHIWRKMLSIQGWRIKDVCVKCKTNIYIDEFSLEFVNKAVFGPAASYASYVSAIYTGD